MGRPRTFDEGVALDRAMDVFWRTGYQATSTEDLIRAMGIGRGSFYNTFGSKRETYLRTLERYLDLLAGGGPYDILLGETQGIGALEAMVDAYLSGVAGEGAARGCYFVHAAKEHRGEDPEVARAIQRGIARMRVILAEHVRAAQRQGALPGHLDPSRTALLLMAVTWGAHVLIEAGLTKEDAISAAKVLFEMRPPVEA